MAKKQEEAKAVSLVSPKGTKVTVAEASVDKYKARGYKAASSK